MDSGALVFIIIIEAIIIIWMASKLTQYHKLDRLLSQGEKDGDSRAQAPAARSEHQPAQASSAPVPQPVAGHESEGVDLLDIPGVDPESNIEEAKRVQLVMARCRYAEFYLEQLDDDYERGQFERIIRSCQSTALGINDPFFRSSALHSIIVLLDRAGWETERNALIAKVDDELVKEQIQSSLSMEAEA